MFSSGKEMEHRLEMGYGNNLLLYYLNYHFKKLKVAE